jgi:hypothetical protein
MNEIKATSMASVNNCGVCAGLLVYSAESVTKICALCGKEEKTNIYCPAGHYICDTCHSKTAMEVLKNILTTARTTDPNALLEEVMAHPSVPTHGPEHHVIVPAVIVAAVRNSGYPLPEDTLDKVFERGGKVPGGWCGLYGDCGAAVGSGIAVSVITGATPLTGKQRTLAMAATSQALYRMLDEQPRCCKRASRVAIQSTVDFLREHLGIDLPRAEKVSCNYPMRNKQCAREKCPYFGIA